MLVPKMVVGTHNTCDFSSVEWLRQLPNNTYYALWLRWPNFDLPMGYNLYIVSFHLEPVDVEWVTKQASRVNAPVVVLSDLNYYEYQFPKNVTTYTYYYWHVQLEKIKQWFPNKIEKHLKFKASAFCNRITQSKMIVFTALAEHLGSHALLKLDDWLEEKNVHYRNSTGIKQIDDVADIFWAKYFGKKYSIDQFDNRQDNVQLKTSNPWTSAYQECVFNFTNESFHYSYMTADQHEFVYPGPFLTEKTLKCLAGGTPFIAVGQFDTYASLINLGFKFDYGELDLAWDQDPGNLTRLSSILDIILDFKKYNIADLDEMSRESTNYNFDHVWSNKFYDMCELFNKRTIESIITKHN
jgi:hypothetical protein